MSRIVRWVWLCSLSVTSVAGVAQAEPRKPTHVACVGDSITAGSGASSPSKNYVSLLQGLLTNAVQVQNDGRSGATMLSAPYGDKPYTLQPEYAKGTDFVSNAGAGAVVSVVIILGANDSKPFNWDPDGKPKNDQQYLKDYLALVDHYAGLSTKPVVYVAYPLATGTNPCCSIRGDVIHDQQIPLIKQVAMQKHVPIIDLNTPTTGHPEYFGDGVHPNDAGYVVMANLVKKGLEREPTVTITSPLTGATLGAGMVPITAEVGADTVDVGSVEFFDGATSLGKVMAKPFTLNWPATTGQHQITAKAVDTTLANATSSAVSITVADGAGGNGGAAGAGVGGANGGANGGASSGASSSGGATGGTSTAGAGASAGGAAGTASAGGSPGSSGSVNAAEPPATDAGCSCSTPGSRDGNAGVSLLVASLLLVAGRRRRAA
jgi:acyl-CoA thioesterase I